MGLLSRAQLCRDRRHRTRVGLSPVEGFNSKTALLCMGLTVRRWDLSGISRKDEQRNPSHCATVSPMRRTTPASTAIGNGERLAYSVAEAAELVGISERRMWDKVREKQIKSFRDGQRRLITRRAIEEYVAAREGEAA